MNSQDVETFKVNYEGEKEIDIEDLTHALNGVNSICKQLNLSNNQNHIKVSAFQEGSWQMVFMIVNAGLFAAENVNTLVDFIANLKKLYVILRGKIPRSEDISLSAKGEYVINIEPYIHIENGANVENIVISPNIYQMYEKKEVRKAMKDLVQPAQNRGQPFTVGEVQGAKLVNFTNEEIEIISKSSLPENEEIDITHEIRQFEVVSFSTDIKHDFIMRQINSSRTLRYSLEDFGFVERIKNKEVIFSDGSRMEALIRIEHRITGNKRNYYNRVIEEVRHYDPTIKKETEIHGDS